MKKYGIAITLVPVLLVMALIFAFSAQTGSESGGMSDRLVRWLLGCVWPGFESLSGLRQGEILEIAGFIVRKGAHFTVFAVLGLFLLLHIRQIGKKICVARPGLWAWGIGTVYAGTDELHQLFVSGRKAAVTDVLIDSAGVLAGIFLLIIFLRRRKKKSQKNIEI